MEMYAREQLSLDNISFISAGQKNINPPETKSGIWVIWAASGGVNSALSEMKTDGSTNGENNTLQVTFPLDNDGFHRRYTTCA